MKAKKFITAVVGLLLLAVFLSLMFTFTVRRTEIVLVSSAMGDSQILIGSDDAGFKWRWPWPFQQVHKLDGRVHILESNQAQVAGAGGGEVMASVYVGWKVNEEKAEEFRKSYESAGSVEKMMAKAEGDLRNAVDASRSEVFGRVNVKTLLAPESEEEGKAVFSKLESEIQGKLENDLKNYGIEVRFVGIKRIALSPTLANSLIEGMVQSKRSRVDAIMRETEARQQAIRDEAMNQFEAAIQEAERNATRIRQEARNKATDMYEEMEKKHPKLAIFLKTIHGLDVLSENQSVIILTDKSPIVSLLRETEFDFKLLEEIDDNETGVIKPQK